MFATNLGSIRAASAQINGLPFRTLVRACTVRVLLVGVQRDMSGIGTLQTTCDGQQSRLAGTRWSDQSHYLACPDLQRDVIQNGAFVVAILDGQRDVLQSECHGSLVVDIGSHFVLNSSVAGCA